MGKSFAERTLGGILRFDILLAWPLSGVSLVSFIFSAILYIDPAILTITMDFQPTNCTTVHSASILGMSNCSWTSCTLGCTSDVYKCWHILVEYSQSGRRARPSLASASTTADSKSNNSPTVTDIDGVRLFPNVKGCGYPPELNCVEFYEIYGKVGYTFPCWVTAKDPNMALTEYNPEKLRKTLMYSLIPLWLFLFFTLYILARLGILHLCLNILRCRMTRTPPVDSSRRLGHREVHKRVLAVAASTVMAFQTESFRPRRTNPAADGVRGGSRPNLMPPPALTGGHQQPPENGRSLSVNDIAGLPSSGGGSTAAERRRQLGHSVHHQSSSSSLSQSRYNESSLGSTEGRPTSRRERMSLALRNSTSPQGKSNLLRIAAANFASGGGGVGVGGRRPYDKNTFDDEDDEEGDEVDTSTSSLADGQDDWDKNCVSIWPSSSLTANFETALTDLEHFPPFSRGPTVGPTAAASGASTSRSRSTATTNTSAATTSYSNNNNNNASNVGSPVAGGAAGQSGGTRQRVIADTDNYKYGEKIS